MTAIAIFGDVLSFLAGNIGAVLGGLGSAVVAVAGWVGARYLAPFLKIGKRKQYAQWIAVIADEITDELVQKYPEKKWLERLNEAVDKLIEICGVSEDVSGRAVNAALGRKKLLDIKE